MFSSEDPRQGPVPARPRRRRFRRGLLFAPLVAALLFLPASASPNVVIELLWIGTAPFCNAHPSDCAAHGMTYVRSDKRGDGNRCFTGSKVLCQKVVQH